MKTITSTTTIDDMTVSLEDIIGALTVSSVIIDDPHLIGFNGEEFDFMGDSQSFYNIISTGTFQLNAKMTKYKDHLTFITEIGIKVGNKEVGVQEIEIFLDGEKINCKYNGTPANRYKMQEVLNFNSGLKNKESSSFYGWAVTDLEREWVNVHAGSCRCHIYVSTEMYEGTVYCPCLNIVLEVEEIGLLSDGVSPHGIVGITAKHIKPRKPTGGHNGEGVIEGESNDYIVSSLLADDFKFNRFGQEPDSDKLFGFRSGNKVEVIE